MTTLKTYHKKLVALALKQSVKDSFCPYLSATEIIKTEYENFTANERLVLSNDINNGLRTLLGDGRGLPFKFELDTFCSNSNIVDEVVKYFEDNNLHSRSDVRKIKSVTLKSFRGDSNPYQTEYYSDDEWNEMDPKYGGHFFFWQLDDMIMLQDLSFALDYRKHCFCTYIDENGTEQKMKYIHSIREIHNNQGGCDYAHIKKPVEEIIKGNFDIVIDEKYIKCIDFEI